MCSLFAACSDKSVNEDGNNKSSENNIELKITTDAHYSSLDESSIKAYEKLWTLFCMPSPLFLVCFSIRRIENQSDVLKVLIIG